MSVYRFGLLRWSALGLAFFLCLNWAVAKPDFASPRPAPTDAARASSETFQAQGAAPLDQGKNDARFAALLDAYRNLTVEGLENGLIPGGWGKLESGHRFYRVNQDNPNIQVVSWLTRSKIREEANRERKHLLTLVSPPRAELSSIKSEFRAVVSKDVDGNGLTDTVNVGYDGAITILAAENGEWKTLSRSPSYAFYEIVSGPGFERVRLTLPTAIDSVDVTGQGYVRVLLQMEISEAVNGRLLGRTTEKHEVLVSLQNSEDDIRFSVDEPPDFTHLFTEQAELRGHCISQKPLEGLQIEHNGEPAWQSPSGLSTTGLRFNLARPLAGGWNLFRITARDVNGYLKRRDLWLLGPEKQPVMQSRNKRAVIVTLDDEWREKPLAARLQAAGFLPDAVTFVSPETRSGEQLLTALRDGKGCEELLLYCEAFSRIGDPAEGKSLHFKDGPVSATDLAQAFDGGGYARVTALFHTELERGFERRRRDNPWRDTDRFLERLGDGGRLVLGNVEDEDSSFRSQRRQSRERLVNALEARAGDDLERLCDDDVPTETLFRGWMHGHGLLTAPDTGVR